jgi:hypothetical protein
MFPLGWLAIAVVLWLLRRRIGRAPLAAVLIFSGSLFPALGFINVYPMRYSFVADHFQYLASIARLPWVPGWRFVMARRPVRDTPAILLPLLGH